MNSGFNPATAAELRHVLNVMEENSHLGLDDEMANRLRRILVRRITEAENSERRSPGTSDAIGVKEAAFLV
jgi:hypothetical protein